MVMATTDAMADISFGRSWLATVITLSKQSGVICSKYVVIDEVNKTITFTGADGVVNGGDNESTKDYVKVEDDYTYEQASDRAPEILREWWEEENN